jgi:hypothetical protein
MEIRRCAARKSDSEVLRVAPEHAPMMNWDSKSSVLILRAEDCPAAKGTGHYDYEVFLTLEDIVRIKELLIQNTISLETTNNNESLNQSSSVIESELFDQKIADNDLKDADIPQEDASWGEVGEFALTYDGYTACGSFEACAAIANAQLHGTLAELRTCLFFEQRRWRHFGEKPDAESMAYIQGLVTQIRNIVSSRSLKQA